MQGVSYSQFLIPGLIMLQVIEQTYGEGSSTVFQGRFMNSIQELLIAPLSAFEMVLGYVVAGVGARALHRDPDHGARRGARAHRCRSNWGIYLLTIVIWSRCCSLRSGSSPGSWRRSSITSRCSTTFFITPLVFVGGVFTSTQFLPPLARTISLFNPMFYMIDAFRYSYTRLGDAPLALVARDRGHDDRRGLRNGTPARFDRL